MLWLVPFAWTVQWRRDDDGLPVYTEPPPRGSSGLGASATRARLRGFPNDKGLDT